MIETLEFIGAIIVGLLSFTVAIFFLLPLLFLGVKAAFFDLKKSIYENKIARKNWENYQLEVRENNELEKARTQIADLEAQIAEAKNNIEELEFQIENLDTTPYTDRMKKRLNACESALHLYKIPPDIITYYEELCEFGKKNQKLYLEGKELGRMDTAKSEYDNIIERIKSIEITHKNGSNLFAVIITGSNYDKQYVTTLSECNCKDFQINLQKGAACKHMFAIAYHTKLLTGSAYFCNPIARPQRIRCGTYLFTP